MSKDRYFISRYTDYPTSGLDKKCNHIKGNIKFNSLLTVGE
jgi:hypothetical protein